MALKVNKIHTYASVYMSSYMYCSVDDVLILNTRGCRVSNSNLLNSFYRYDDNKFILDIVKCVRRPGV